MINTEYYKYGYYSIPHSTKTTRSKLEAIDWCKVHQSWPQYHFYDEVYSSYNWSKEPEHTLEYLYQQRAKEIREKYDYVVIMYSGGSDSHNMLMSFLSQGIIPDEIAFFYHSFDDNNVMNREWQLQTEPRIKKIQQLYPSIKLRRIDMTQMVLDHMKEFRDDCGYLSTNISPNNSLRSRFNELIPDWANIKNTGRSLRILYGVDKPRLRFYNNKWIFNFYDFTRNGSADRPEFDDQEWFYWSQDSVELCIKQSHIVRRFWSANQPNWINMKCTYNNDLGWLMDKENSQAMQLIYPWCNDSVFLTWRASNDFFGNRDIEIFHSNLVVAQQYIQMCRGIIGWIDPMYFNQGQVEKGLVGSISQDYVLG